MLNLKALTLTVIIGVLTPIVSINILPTFTVLAQTQEERKAEADRLLEQGSQQSYKSQFQEALQSFQKALEIYREIGNSSGEADVLSGFSTIYNNLGQYDQAIKFERQALKIYQAIGDLKGEANSYLGLGNIYHNLGQYDKALKFERQALKIYRETGERVWEANSYLGLGNTYHNLGQYDKAIEFYHQALTINQEIGEREGEANSSISLGNTYRNLGQYEKAIDFYQQALKFYQTTEYRGVKAMIFSNIGIALELQKQPELAITFLKIFVNITEAIRQDIQGLSQDLQQSYTDAITSRYRNLADLLLSQGRIAEAQQVLELLKVQELREFTRNRNIRESTESISLNEFEQQVIDEYGSLIDFGSQIYNCEQTQCDPKKLEKLKDQRRQLSDEFDTKIKEQIALIRENRKADDVFYDPRFLSETARDIVEAQPGTVLIYPLVLEDKLWILWTTAGGVAGRKEIPVTQQELGNEVVKLRAFLESPNSNLQELQTTAQQLYEWLIEPIESELTKNQIQRLVFAQDRVTRYIPMAALYDGESYLIQKYTIHSILSAELTDMDDKLAPGTDVNSMLALGLSDAVPGFDPLPNVEIELDGIVVSDNNDSQGIYQGEKFLNQGFTFDTLSQNVANHRILHIATHGKFEAGVPEASFLLLGTGERLTIPEINSIGSELRDVHLVVLSACETALGGPDAEGIEIAGISSYFLQAGRASAVMASLWLVNDPATSELMQQFYGQLSTGKTKAEALQQAQLSFLGETEILAENRQRTGDGTVVVIDPETNLPKNVSNNFSHPYYWAPFILIGNGL